MDAFISEKVSSQIGQYNRGGPGNVVGLRLRATGFSASLALDVEDTVVSCSCILDMFTVNDSSFTSTMEVFSAKPPKIMRLRISGFCFLNKADSKLFFQRIIASAIN